MKSFALTASQMRQADRKAIEELGIPALLLMENAGALACDLLLKEYHCFKEAWIFCGPGNNGGDGLVLARHLICRGKLARCILTGPEDDYAGEASTNLALARIAGATICQLSSINDEELLGLDGQMILVDAIYGTGSRNTLPPQISTLLDGLNRCSLHRVAIDLPTGLPSHGAPPCGPVFNADITFAIGAKKPAHLMGPGRDLCGKVILVPISIPPHCLPDNQLQILEDFQDIPILPPRKSWSHKGSYGHLMLMGGSMGKEGAIFFAASAALNMGLGLCSVLGRGPRLLGLFSGMPQVMLKTFDSTLDTQNIFEGKKAILAGPGLGLDQEARVMLDLAIASGLPLVLDADALNILSSMNKPWPLPPGSLLTPHPGEAARLSGCSTADVEANTIDVARELARESQAVVLLKGAGSLIACPDGRIVISARGDHCLARGGSGDVLAGIAGALLAQGHRPFEAACTASFILGVAGESRCPEDPWALHPMELTERIPSVLAKIMENQSE